MFSAKSSTIACPTCGRENRATARFCEACAARLGAEPSIAPPSAPSTGPATVSGRADSHFDALRTVHSRPLPLSPPPASNAGFWIKFGIAGLVVMIGFIAWSLYIMTSSKAVPQLSTAPGGVTAAPVVTSTSPGQSPSPSSSAAPASVPTVPPAMAVASPPMASSVVPPAAQPQRVAPDTRMTRAAPQRQAAARERSRPSPTEARPADFGAWVEPSRAPAMTSSPNYQDAGPPVVTGPGPRELSVASTPAPTTGGTGAARTQDLGPPITVGPGPRFDYSTPSAGAR